VTLCLAIYTLAARCLYPSDRECQVMQTSRMQI